MLSASEFKSIGISQELKGAVYGYLECKAYIETIKPEIYAIYNQLLADRPYYIPEKRRKLFLDPETKSTRIDDFSKVTEDWRIIDRAEDYMMSGDDFAEYHGKAEQIMKERGYDFPAGSSPLTMAELALSDWGSMIVNGQTYISGLDDQYMVRHWMERKELIELTIKMVVTATESADHFWRQK